MNETKRISDKICTKCGDKHPATTEHWHVNRAYKGGLDAQCKRCKNLANEKLKKRQRRGRPRLARKAFPRDRLPADAEGRQIDNYLFQVDVVLLQAGPVVALETLGAIKPFMPRAGYVEMEIMELALQQMARRVAIKQKEHDVN